MNSWLLFNHATTAKWIEIIFVTNIESGTTHRRLWRGSQKLPHYKIKLRLYVIAVYSCMGCCMTVTHALSRTQFLTDSQVHTIIFIKYQVTNTNC